MLINAISEAIIALLPTAKALSHKARVEASSDNDNEVTSFEEKAVPNSVKVLSAQIASPCGEVILASHSARRSASKAKSKVKPKTFQPIRANV